MQPITAPIKQNQTGSVVLNLMECILFLISKKLLKIYEAPNKPTQSEIDSLVEGAKKEMAAQVFGENAQRLVFYFQIQNGLGDALHGLVDDKTAALLNQMLEKCGAITVEKIFVVTGIVTDSETGARQTNMKVKAFDRDGKKLTPLGESNTNLNGEFSINFSEAAYKNTPAEREGVELVVKAYDELGLEVGHASLTTSETTILVNITTQSDLWVVEGRVTRGDLPLNHVLIEVFDRDLRKRQSLKQTVTDKNGYYRALFRTQDFQRGDKKIGATPWLIIEAKENKETDPLVIEKKNGVLRQNIIDIHFSQILASEFELISDAINPLLEGQAKLSAGNESLAVNEITPSDYYFLEHETGFAQNIIDAWVRAFNICDAAKQQLSDLYALEKATLQEHGWPFFYAFSRKGDNVDLKSIIKISSEKLESGWSSARGLNFVPALNEKTISILLNTIEILRKIQLLIPSEENNNSLVQILDNIPYKLPQPLAIDALALYQEKGLSDPDAFLDLKNTHPNSDIEINRLVRHIRVNNLVGGHSEFAEKLHSHLTDASDSIAPLAAISSKIWLAMAKEASFGAGLALQTQAFVEKLHPLVALQAKITNQNSPIPNITPDELSRLLKNESESVENLMQGKTAAIDKPDLTETHKAIRAVGRFVRSGLSIEQASDLIKAGVESPAHMLRQGRDQSIEQLINISKGAAKELIENVFKNIDRIIDGANGFFTAGAIAHASHTAVSQLYDNDSGKITLSDSVRENLPTLNGFFGDMDECICKPCESMLGQPAYLVDLLNLLRKNKNAFNSLRVRRPHIFTTKLDCENTEKPIEHIDIVLEILEEQAGKNTSHSSQVEVAYRNLSTAIYPWSLPYDRSHSEVSAFLAKFGISRVELLRTIHPTNLPVIAAESLQCTHLDWLLLTQKRSALRLWNAYGFTKATNIEIRDAASGNLLSNQSLPDLLTIASVLCDRTGLSLEELESALATRFVGQLSLTNRDQCKTSQMHISNLPEGVSLEDVLDRLHRLVRLRKKISDWTFEELDSVMVALDGVEDERVRDAERQNTLVKIAQLKSISDKFNLPVSYLVGKSAAEPGLPVSINKILPLLGLTLTRFNLLKAITGLQLSTAGFAWGDFENFCTANQRINESGLSIEQVAEVLLSQETLVAQLGELPKSIKTSNQLELLINEVQERLRAVSSTSLPTNLNELESSVAQTLGTLLNRESAQIIIAAIQSASATTPVEIPNAFELLQGTSTEQATRKLGDIFPLLSDSQTNEIIGVASQLSATERFTRLLRYIAARLREVELVKVIAEQTGLLPVEVSALLQSRLQIDETTLNASVSTTQASDVFLNEKFWADFYVGSATTPSIPSTAITDIPNIYSWMERLYRLIALKDILSLDVELMQIADYLVTANGDKFQWKNLLASRASASNIAWANSSWQSLLDFVWLQNPQTLSRPVLNEMLTRLQMRDTGAVTVDDIRPLATRIQLADNDALNFSNKIVATTNAKNLRNPTQLKKIFEFLLLVKHLGANNSQIDQLIDLSHNTIASATAQTLLQSRVDESEWEDVLKAVKDPIRQQRRDALVAYLINLHDSKNWSSVNDLYDYFLIDPKVEPSVETTRVLEAITAVQLFIQRLLFGLEKGMTLGVELDLLKQRWTWMRNYRVWEANRKVFLFPENWLFPELRDDKSSSFKQLESTLGQGELTQEIAQQSFGQFLDDVAQMGQIEVLGMYEDVPSALDENVQRNKNAGPEVGSSVHKKESKTKNNSSLRILYVVGRTPNPPYAYYWRSCYDFGGPNMEWAPWQRIELDIQGDHVMPFVLGGQFYIAWPIMRIKQQDNDKVDWEVKLSWTRYDGKSWKKISLSREAIYIPDVAFMDERWSFSFRCKLLQDVDTTEIELYTLEAIDGTSKTKPASEDDHERNTEFNVILNKEIISNLIKADCANNSIDTSLFHFDSSRLQKFIFDNYPNLPEMIRDHFEVYAMAYEYWCVPPYDKIMNENGGDGLYYQIQHNLLVGGIYHGLFEHPFEAIGIHKNARDTNNTNLKGALFQKSANEILDRYLDLMLSQQTGAFTGENFKNKIKEASSSLELKCEVWVRITVPGLTNTDLKKVDGQKGTFTCNVNGQNLSPTTPVKIIKLGKQEPLNCKMIVATANFTLPTSAAETTIEVPVNRTIVQTIKFEINGSNLNPVQLLELGIDLNDSRNLLLNSKFILKSDNNVKVMDLSKSQLYISNSLLNSKPWMNGYKENILLGVDPTYPLNISNIEVMPQTLKEQFWAVEASSTSGASSNIWHYSENQYGSYIDLGFVKNADNTGLGIYADSYSESATAYRLSWNKSSQLIQPDLNTGSFSANKIPSLSSKFNTNDWIEVQSGKRAFDARLPYACYNWEVFFHAPLLVADQLSKQHKFEEAEQWLRYVFDPTNNQPSTDPNFPAKSFLKFRVFRELNLTEQVIDDLTALAQAASGVATSRDTKNVINLIKRWQTLPFRPFLIARNRQIAFLWRTLFAYLDNLIAWGDSLYRRDTVESVNEATMLYVLAEKILGRRPQLHQGGSNSRSLTYDEMDSQFDAFANYWIDTATRSDHRGQGTSNSDLELPNPEGHLLFCLPFNDKILSYWNIVETRLDNLRNSRNIEGVVRKLPFMDAPIDPELLIRATAAGLDIGDVISGLYAPAPHYRYAVLAARAVELISETKSLGAALLSAIEKRDAEQISQLRSSNEISLLKLVSDLKKLQISEAERNIEALRASRKSTESRYNQYQRLIGIKDIAAPKENETAGEVAMLGSHDDGLASHRSGLGLIKEENEQYLGIEGGNTWAQAANIAKVVGGGLHVAAAIAAPLPTEKLTEASKALNYLGTAASTVGDAFSAVSLGWRTYAEQQGMLAGHLRRRDEWAFQSNQTLKELQQIDKQLLANQIRIDITRKDLENHFAQIEQSKAMDEVLRSKFTNDQLYQWMLDQLTKLYFSSYRMALDMARRAERAASRELGTKPLNILGNDYWDSLRMGLLAGEKLHQDLKRLEISYIDQNYREYELTKHISLRRLDSTALMNLRFKNSEQKNVCEFDLPEWLFDLDTSGHYLRRIKSVSVSIPCVVGPYTSVNCKLTLLKSSIRHDRLITRDDYLRKEEDDRFTDYFGASEAIVTSTANSDSGLFETQLHDERFLPFEHAGVISSWRLELPDQYAQFDYSTISDVILTVRYTAREGGEPLRVEAVKSINALLATSVSTNPKTPLKFPLLLSCRSDFPTEWAQAKTTNETLKVPIKKEIIPYWLEAASINKIHSAKVKTLNGKNLTELADATLSEVNGVTIADTNVQLTQPIPSDIFLFVEIGKV